MVPLYMILVSQVEGAAVLLLLLPMTLFFSGSDLVVRLTNRLLFLCVIPPAMCDPDMEESGSVDAAVDPPELDDDPPDTDADEEMLLQGAVV